MKDLIFISHANPEDNFFTAWLASKLSLMGYRVWADVNNISPGQYFNRDFEKVIREDAIKFLPILTNSYIKKSAISDSGVMNELLVARTLSTNDFIVPIKLDDCNYNEFPTGVIGRLAISFENNWGKGLKELLFYLEKEDVHTAPVENNVVKFWYDTQKIITEPILKPERYFTNWLEVELPEFVFVYRANSFEKQDLYSSPYSFIFESDRIISFCSEELFQNFISINSVNKIKTELLLQSTPLTIDNEFVLNDPNKKLVKLLNSTLTTYLFQTGLKVYRQANKKRIFHFPYSPINKKMINLSKFNRGRRAIMGTTSDFTWYFAISHSASLSPIACFKIAYHIIFTDNHGKYLETSDQHELRRSLASNWFNRKWFETLLAMIFKISKYSDDGNINIPIDDRNYLIVKQSPVSLISEYGYNEP